MEPVQHISKGGIVYAIIFRKPKADGTSFFCADSDEFQIGIMERPAGYQVKAHMHPRSDRTISGVCEFLYIESGKISVNVYDAEWSELASAVLEAGEFLVFFRGGHAIEVLETARVVEVKQGPYPGAMASKLFRDAS